MRTSRIITSLFILCLLASACVRKNDIIAPAPSPVAGKLGKTTLRITPERRGVYIDSCIVYLKYNTLTKPDSFRYDDSLWVKKIDGKPIAKFDSLSQGNYYMYAVGWDTNVADTVRGGASFSIIDTIKQSYDIYVTVNQR